MGDDCLRAYGIRCGLAVSIGEWSGVWVPWEAVEGDRLAGGMLSWGGASNCVLRVVEPLSAIAGCGGGDGEGQWGRRGVVEEEGGARSRYGGLSPGYMYVCTAGVCTAYGRLTRRLGESR